MLHAGLPDDEPFSRWVASPDDCVLEVRAWDHVLVIVGVSTTACIVVAWGTRYDRSDKPEVADLFTTRRGLASPTGAR